MTENREKVLNQKEIGRRVRLRREHLGLSREQLAEKIDVSNQFIADIEYGNRGMSLETLYKMSKILKTSADYFLAGKIYEEKKYSLPVTLLLVILFWGCVYSMYLGLDDPFLYYQF